MENENDTVEETGTEVEETSDTTVQQESLDAKNARLEREVNRLHRKLDKFTTQPKEKEEIKPADLDYGQKAFLKASGINGADEVQLAKDFARRTGLDYDTVVEDDIFKAKLEALRTTKANQQAADTGGSGGATVSKNSAEYYLAKGEEPPVTAPREVRSAYVKLRTAAETNKKMFYND